MTKKQMRQKIQEIGGYSVVAKWCGVTRQAVRAWTRFKLRHCLMIYKGSAGKVLPGELRGDVHWVFNGFTYTAELVEVRITINSKQIMKSDY